MPSAKHPLTTTAGVAWPPTSILREQAETQRELHVVRAMVEVELFLNALLVRVDGLRADEQLLADLRRRVALADEPQHVALAHSQLLVTLAVRLRGILL